MQANLDPALGNIVKYYLVVNNKPTSLLNDHIGKNISLDFSGSITCIYCHKKINKSYNQGYCYVCATTLARCDWCIVSPQKCHYRFGTCREPIWGQENCFIPHIVYLANTSGLKVGIAREINLLNRWIDQGAIQGLPIIRTKSRYQAGLIEFMLSKIIDDKTNWRKMLSFRINKINLIEARNKLLTDCYQELNQIINQFPISDIEILQNSDLKDIVEINYPNCQKPHLSNVNNDIKLSSLNSLIKPNVSCLISDELLAIKGQYLIFLNGVLNVRNLTGHQVVFSGSS